MLTEEQKMATLGLVTILMQRRKELDAMEITAAKYLVGIGCAVHPGSSMAPRDYVGEAVYNYGDDPEKATTELLEAVGLGLAS